MKENQRQYTIPLRRYYINTPKYKRSKKAISLIKEFIKKHMKIEDVRIGKQLNEYVWRNGIKNPPSKVRVVATKEDSYITVELEGHTYTVEKIQTEATPDKPTGLKGKLQEKTKSLTESGEEKEESEKESEETTEKPKEKAEKTTTKKTTETKKTEKTKTSKKDSSKKETKPKKTEDKK